MSESLVVKRKEMKESMRTLHGTRNTKFRTKKGVQITYLIVFNTSKLLPTDENAQDVFKLKTLLISKKKY